MISAISLVWELPLAIASRCLFLIVRFFLRKMARLHYSREKDQAVTWRMLSADLLQHPLALPVVMTEGPRWNTHAVIGRVGPLPVRESIDLEIGLADSSAHAWTIVIYSFPDHRTVASLGPKDRSGEENWIRVPLRPGRYSLILRYYTPSAGASLPAVGVDGQPLVANRPVPTDINDFYADLIKRRRGFYFLLHYHAFVALRHRAWLPRRLVERVYLPVGNPETSFRYGALQRRDVLNVRLTQRDLETRDVYVTVYDVASFPVAWQRIESMDCRLGPFQRRCTYLVRIHPRSATCESAHDDVQVSVQ